MRFFFVLTGLTLALSVHANEPKASPLKLKEALRQGLDFSLELKKAESEKRAAEDNYSLAQSELFPTIDFDASGGTTKSSATVSSLSSTTTHIKEDYKASLTLEQTLYHGGVITAGLSAAKLSLNSANQKVFAARQEYSFKVIGAFLDTAEAQTLLDIAKSNRDVLKSYRDVTARYAAIGRSKNIDRLQADANFSISEAQVLEAETDLENKREEFIRLLGDADLRSREVDTNMTVQPIDVGKLDDLLNKALEQNPEIKSLELEVESKKYSNRVKLSEHKPRLYLKGYYGYEAPQRREWFDKPSEIYSLTLNLSVPLFSGFSSFAESAAYSEDLVQLEKDLAIRRQDLQKSLAQALATVGREFERLKLTQSSSSSSKKAMDVAIRDYRNGLLSSTDVLSIQRTRFDSEKQFILAQYSYNRQVLSLRRDLGIDLEKAYDKNL